MCDWDWVLAFFFIFSHFSLRLSCSCSQFHLMCIFDLYLFRIPPDLTQKFCCLLDFSIWIRVLTKHTVWKTKFPFLFCFLYWLMYHYSQPYKLEILELFFNLHPFFSHPKFFASFFTFCSPVPFHYQFLSYWSLVPQPGIPSWNAFSHISSETWKDFISHEEWSPN